MQAATAQQAVQAVQAVTTYAWIKSLNSSPYLIGTAMVLMNMGSRYVFADITELQDKAIKSTPFKQLVLFCIMFIATRDVMVASMLWAAYNVIVNVLFNDRQKYNIIRFLLPQFYIKTLKQYQTNI